MQAVDRRHEVAPSSLALNVNLELRDNVLVLSGEKRAERKEEDDAHIWSERSFGRFQRVIPLDTEIDADKVDVEAHFTLLKVIAPKNAKAVDKARRIEIRPN